MTSSSSRKWFWIVPAILIAGAIALRLTIIPPREAKPAAANEVPISNNSVGCRGRAEPEGGVIRVAAPYFAGRPTLVAQLKVNEGDWVQPGQILAVLDNNRQLEAALEQSKAGVLVARRRLEQVKEGAKPSDIAAQEAEVARDAETLENAKTEYTRYERLFQTHDISSSDLDQRRLAVQAAQRTLEESKHRLESLSTVRKTDIDTAEAELQVALAGEVHAQAQLDSSVVRAPREGSILKIHTKAGEEVGLEGILELGDTRHMVVIAEVYETDISKVHKGQHATITRESGPEKLDGIVEEIGSEIRKNSVLPTDPVAFSDARIVEVKILVPNSSALSNLTYGKFDVEIHL